MVGIWLNLELSFKFSLAFGFHITCGCFLFWGQTTCVGVDWGTSILPRSVFKSSQIPLTVCPGTSLSKAGRGLNCWVGEEGFRYSLVRTARPLWLLHNPLQHIMCIMAAEGAFVTSWGRLTWVCLVHISPHLSNAVSTNLCLTVLLSNTISLLCSSPGSLLLSILPSLSIVWCWGGWGRGREEISGDYHCLENTDGFVRHLRSWMLCQPALD